MIDSRFMPLVSLESDFITSKVVDVMLLLGRKQKCFIQGVILLFTLHILLNAIVRFLQLNTERGADANLKVDY